jgi:hypothetical protein
MVLSYEFIQAWNDEDFISLEPFVHDSIEYHSPLINSQWLNNTENIIRGKEQFMSYLKETTMRKVRIKVNLDSIQNEKEQE